MWGLLIAACTDAGWRRLQTRCGGALDACAPVARTQPAMLTLMLMLVGVPAAAPACLQKHEKLRREKAGGQVDEIDENFIRLYWEQMLQVGGWACGERVVGGCTEGGEP